MKKDDNLDIEIKFNNDQIDKHKFVTFIIDKILENMELIRGKLDEFGDSEKM